MLKEETEELRAKESKQPPVSGTGAKIDPATELPPPDETSAEAEAAVETPAS